MAEQKKVLALHDLAALGRAALVPVLAALSGMGHQCVPVPTAVFSTHAGIAGFQTADLTGWMGSALAHYAALGVTFDGVLSGFLSAPEQVELVQRGAALRRPGGIFLVDPVMGDNGALYRACTPALAARMGELCRGADVMTPNVTEAAVLTGRAPDAVPRGLDEAADWARALEARYGARVALTGLADGDRLTVLCCADGQVCTAQHARIGAYYPGTGDLFAAVLLGGLLRGLGLQAAAQGAADFVGACIAATVQQGGDPRWGVAVETQIWRLIP